MVWFQCEGCGDSIKKPRLAKHFQMCAAPRLSCIDCGVSFTQQSVLDHSRCLTEAEKYHGEKGKLSTKGNSQDPRVDESKTLGLATHPPWKCSLCNVACTSEDTLAGHAEGKKHKAKVKRAILEKEEALKVPQPIQRENAEIKRGESAAADEKKKAGEPKEVKRNGKDEGQEALIGNMLKRPTLKGKKNRWKRLGIKLIAKSPEGKILVKDFGRKLDKKVKKKGLALPETFLKEFRKEGILEIRDKLVSLKRNDIKVAVYCDWVP